MSKLSLAFCFALLAAAVQAVDSIVPMMIHCGDDLDGYARDIREASRRYGLRRFAIIGIGTEKTHFNLTSPEVWRQFGEQIATLREKVGEPDVEFGWWCVPTLRQGPNSPFVRIRDDAGGRAKTAICPLDPEFRKTFFAGVETTARAARPTIVFFEDDYELMWHTGLNEFGGCFCPRHLAAFRAAAGTNMTARQVGELFRRRTPENRRLRELFAYVQRDSLVDFAKGIRTALDRVDPKIRTCICESWKEDTDGGTSVPVARALAGPNTRPAIRVFGSAYNCENESSRLSSMLGHLACTVADAPADVELFHEMDTYPHSRFYNSAAFVASAMTGAFMSGVHQTYYYCTEYLDDPFEDPAYAELYGRNRRRFAAIRAFRSRADLVGVRTTYRPSDHYLVRFRPSSSMRPSCSDASRFLAKLGFPFAPRKGPMTLLIGDSVETLEDDEIRTLLKGGCFIDAPSAAALAARGFGELLGVDVERADERMEVYHERMTPVSGYARKGKFVNCYLLGQAVAEDNGLVRLSPKEGAEVWAEYLGLGGTRVAPSVTYFENRLGGRIGVMAQAIPANNSSSVFSSRKQELLKILFDRISQGQLPVTSTATPSVWLLAAESRDGHELMFMANNLAGETRDDLRFEFAPRWAGRTVYRLSDEGEWQQCGVTAVSWMPRIAFGFCQSEVFLITARQVSGCSSPNCTNGNSLSGCSSPNCTSNKE